eukprot:NODE_3416_length_400_cov_394.712251_g2877_i0.p1 GENE.NODE_3416_length_400_cov_394.712251_g2877_i0~~NODE_3416_length_400_cov_394.712251_g2877_i0.p1  ORF type:complete len:107 (-),score=0.71 NODE_3416_length_400_cov_394.712251_g2877_i0:51-371(-)
MGFFGMLIIINSLNRFYFDVEDDPEKRKSDPPSHFSAAAGIATIGIAIWGAAITFGHVGNYGECSGMAFYTAFCSCTICLSIVTLMLVRALVKKFCCKQEESFESV